MSRVAVGVGVMAVVSFPGGWPKGREMRWCVGLPSVSSAGRCRIGGGQTPTSPGQWVSGIMPEQAADIGSRGETASRDAPESAYAWTRLFAALLLSAIGGVGMWSVIVVLPAVQAEFGVARAAASLPYTATMICFGFGGILMGRLSDRFGIFVPVVAGTPALG